MRSSEGAEVHSIGIALRRCGIPDRIASIRRGVVIPVS